MERDMRHEEADDREYALANGWRPAGRSTAVAESRPQRSDEAYSEMIFERNRAEFLEEERFYSTEGIRRLA